MKDKTGLQTLEDGVYPCSAALHIKDGKAIIVLHSMFNLTPGVSIPLYRQENDMQVVANGGEPVGIRNGHAII
jgi:hypothetical protein